MYQKHFQYMANRPESDSEPKGQGVAVKNIAIKVLNVRPCGPNNKTKIMGEIFYLPAKGNDPALFKRLQDKKNLDIITYIPLDQIGDTVVFDKLMVYENLTATYNANVFMALDPRTACQTPGTKQNNEKAYTVMLNLSGKATPTPCQSCKCNKKFSP